MLWQATSRHQERLLSLASVVTLQQTGMAGKWAHSVIRGGKFTSLWAPFLISSPTSLLLLSCEFQHTIYTSTLRNPSAQRSRMLAFFFFFFSKHLISTCTESYNRIQYWRCFQFWFSQQRCTITSVSIPPTFSSWHSFDHLQDVGEMLVVAAEPLFVCLFLTWHLTSWQRCRVPKRRAGVDVVDLLGRIWPTPHQELPNCFPPQRNTQCVCVFLSLHFSGQPSVIQVELKC